MAEMGDFFLEYACEIPAPTVVTIELPVWNPVCLVGDLTPEISLRHFMNPISSSANGTWGVSRGSLLRP